MKGFKIPGAMMKWSLWAGSRQQYITYDVNAVNAVEVCLFQAHDIHVCMRAYMNSDMTYERMQHILQTHL